MYDYGPETNIKIYNGMRSPPEYNLSAVDVPLTIMYGSIDGLAVPTVRFLSSSENEFF